MAVPLKKAGMAVLAVALVAALVTYVYYDRHGRYFQDTNDATIQADQVSISSKLAGYVRAVAVDDNQQVAEGALLIEIDPTDYQTKVAAADAAIASAVEAENAAKFSHAEALAGVETARAQLRAAKANFDYASRELARYQPLVAAGIQSASALSQLTANCDRANAEMASARAAQSQAEQHVESIAAQGAQLAAEIDVARVQRQAASNDLNATRLIAPVAGRVANRSVRAGQFVQPGMRLMTIVPSQDIYVVANFKETQVGLMRPGLQATIRVDALPGVEFRGEVTSVTPGTGANFSLIPPQNATGNFTKIIQRVPVRIHIEAGPAARRVLVPGLSLDVEVDTRAASDELDAMRKEQER
ncbi:MAG: HlyD family secretion protein [Rhodospirillaceae bacterium]|nr:MAG: HlyD family secretion protein [Rhodospirillaceae bacterium]